MIFPSMQINHFFEAIVKKIGASLRLISALWVIMSCYVRPCYNAMNNVYGITIM